MAMPTPPKLSIWKRIYYFIMDNTLGYLFPLLKRFFIYLAHKEKDKKRLENITQSRYWRIIKKLT